MVLGKGGGSWVCKFLLLFPPAGLGKVQWASRWAKKNQNNILYPNAIITIWDEIWRLWKFIKRKKSFQARVSPLDLDPPRINNSGGFYRACASPERQHYRFGHSVACLFLPSVTALLLLKSQGERVSRKSQSQEKNWEITCLYRRRISWRRRNEVPARILHSMFVACGWFPYLSFSSVNKLFIIEAIFSAELSCVKLAPVLNKAEFKLFSKILGLCRNFT